jgi:hypothetical protein
MSTATIQHVRVILTQFPQLKRLILLDCPSILSEDIRELLDAEPQLINHLEALIHPFLLGELNDASDNSPYRNAFAYVGIYGHGLKACSLPFFTPSRVIQALIDTLQPIRDPTSYLSYSFLQTSLAMQAAFSSVREPGKKWSERGSVIIPHLSLRSLKGEGWTFATNIDMYTNEGGRYAFLRFNLPSGVASDKIKPEVEVERASDGVANPAKAPALTWEIHDVASFVNKVTLDGRPHPTDEAVGKLQEIMKNMPLMGDEDVKKFVKSATMSVRRLY